jgi:hypothetical protein
VSIELHINKNTRKLHRTADGFKAQGIAAAKQSNNAKKKSNDMLSNKGPEGKRMLGLWYLVTYTQVKIDMK